jgi:hypothetical protein
MQTGKCPICNSDIVVDDEAYEGDLATCTICDSDLEIISLHPPKFSVIEGNPSPIDADIE